jgi:hypothetical protein
VDVNFDVANVNSGNSVGLTFNVSDMAPDVQNVQVKATGSAEAGDKVTFVFEAEEDVVVLDGSSTISGFSSIEVQNGTVDFTALGGAALTDTTLLLGSGAIVTATQLLTLTDVEIREGAVDGDLTVNFAVGDDAAAVISKLGEFSDLAVKVRVEGGALTEAEAGQMSAVASDVTGETDGEAVVSTYTLQELIDIDSDARPDAYVLSDGVVVAEGAITVANATEFLPVLLAIVAGAQNGDEITLSPTYTLSDTLANLTAADAALVSGAASYTLSDASLTAADLTAVAVADLAADQSDAVAAVRADAIVDGATNGDTITVNNGTYTLSDTVTNLIGADSAVLNGSAGITATGNATLVQADAILAAAGSSVSLTLVQDSTSFAGFVSDILDTESGNSLSFALAAGTYSAADLAALDAWTMGSVDATGITAVSGTASAIAALASASGIDLPTGAYNITVTGTLAPSELTSLDAMNGAGTLDYSGATLTGTAAELVADAGGYVAGGTLASVTGPINMADAATIIGSIAAANLTVTAFSDTAANIATVTGDASLAVTNNATATITITDGNISVANAILLDADTTGVVTATITEGDLATLTTLTDANSNNAFTIVVTDTTNVDPAALTTVDGLTSVTVDATAVGSLSGTAANIDALLGDDVTLAADVDITVSGAATIAQLTAFNAATTGTVSYTAVSDTAAALVADAGNYVTAGIDVTVTDDVTIAQASALDAYNTTGTLTFSTGFIDSNANIVANNGGYVGADAVEVNDSSITVAEFTTLAGLHGAITATIAENDIATLLGLDNGTVGESGNDLTVVINDAAVTVVNLGNIDDNATSITINADDYSNTLDFALYGGGVGLTINGLGRADNIIGTANDDTINGGDDDDVITGGDGIDTVTGGLGADTFVFNTIVATANASNIQDFEADDDILQFDAVTFDAYVAGVGVAVGDVANNLTDANTVLVDTVANVVTAAVDTTNNAGVVFIASDTGDIYYDADGDFTVGAVIIGSITAGEVGDLAADNFVIA